jgi:serine/threonine protein kinase
MPAAPAIPGFNLERPLASGRHGTVWAARRRGDDAAVALKLVPTERVGDAARFLREAGVLAAIEHPHIVRCLDSGQHGEVLWLAMERAAGDLASELKRGPLASERLLSVGRDAAAGLAALHERGLVHRDITPANLLGMPDGRVVLGDFGLIHGGHERLTATGEVLGTPAYLSPEQAAGTPVEARSDIYALGAVLYALATGQPPYQGDGAWGVLALIAKGPFPDPRDLRPDLPLELRAIIRAATGLRPEQRYDSVGLLGEDCAAVLAGGTPRHAGALRARLSPGEIAPPVPATPRRGPLPRVLAAAASLLGGLLLGWLISRPDPAERAAFAVAMAAGDAAAWQAYAGRFPAGLGAEAAKRALAVLDQPAPAADDERLRLQREIELLQAELTRLGRERTP